MKTDKNSLFREFYFQYTLNKIRPWYVTEYDRETAIQYSWGVSYI